MYILLLLYWITLDLVQSIGWITPAIQPIITSIANRNISVDYTFSMSMEQDVPSGSFVINLITNNNNRSK